MSIKMQLNISKNVHFYLILKIVFFMSIYILYAGFL